jgi:hypothetical protein
MIPSCQACASRLLDEEQDPYESGVCLHNQCESFGRSSKDYVYNCNYMEVNLPLLFHSHFALSLETVSRMPPQYFLVAGIVAISKSRYIGWSFYRRKTFIAIWNPCGMDHI